jgi:hypothetical protein
METQVRQLGPLSTWILFLHQDPQHETGSHKSSWDLKLGTTLPLLPFTGQRKLQNWLGMVVHTCNPSIQEAEASGLRV